MFAPSRAARSAIASPIPRLAPVIKSVLPFKSATSHTRSRRRIAVSFILRLLPLLILCNPSQKIEDDRRRLFWLSYPPLNKLEGTTDATARSNSTIRNRLHRPSTPGSRVAAAENLRVRTQFPTAAPLYATSQRSAP